MSHTGNTTILEQHLDDALELTRHELLAELAESVGRLIMPGDTRLEQNTAFLFLLSDASYLPSHAELAEHVANKRFSESAQIPC